MSKENICPVAKVRRNDFSVTLPVIEQLVIGQQFMMYDVLPYEMTFTYRTPYQLAKVKSLICITGGPEISLGISEDIGAVKDVLPSSKVALLKAEVKSNSLSVTRINQIHEIGYTNKRVQ